ncbi:MAG: U32 family peptidase [Lachnospiraceae bacterium]|nr:U32 family peptidase [Lachnospiraceae bacterium]
MKLVVGIHNAEDYIEVVKAGADEVFFGYVPTLWGDLYGIRSPMNRREVRNYNVQIGGENDLFILRQLQKKYPAELTVAMNSLFYSDRQRETVMATVKELKELGFSNFIVAEEALLKCLAKEGGVNLHVSGELGEMNRGLALYLKDLLVKRIIFPRQTTILEMESITSKVKGPEYEAFLLNEKCHFTGAYCNSLHCDELCPMCHVPYSLKKGNQEVPIETDGEYDGKLGESGCGLCALYRLEKAGITHLKIVSRGNHVSETVRDVKACKRALAILKRAKSEKEYQELMKKELFPTGCSKECYYRECLNELEDGIPEGIIETR